MQCCECNRSLVSVIPYSDYDSDETPDNVGIKAKSRSAGALCAACRRDGRTIVSVTKTESAGVTRVEQAPEPQIKTAPKPAPKGSAGNALRRTARAFRNALVDRDR